MQVCSSLQADNHASTAPLSFLQAGCPSCHPTNSVKALKAYFISQQTRNPVSATMEEIQVALGPLYRFGPSGVAAVVDG